MNLLTGEQIQPLLEGLIHSPTQVNPWWVDLTVARLERLTKRGSLDFGGSEYRTGQTVPLKARKPKEGEKYGWWELGHGIYLVRYNETLMNLPDNHAVLLTPHPRLVATGCVHSTSYLYRGDELTAVIEIPQAGCALKENCRISRLQVFRVSYQDPGPSSP